MLRLILLFSLLLSPSLMANCDHHNKAQETGRNLLLTSEEAEVSSTSEEEKAWYQNLSYFELAMLSYAGVYGIAYYLTGHPIKAFVITGSVGLLTYCPCQGRIGPCQSLITGATALGVGCMVFKAIDNERERAF